MSKDIKMVVGGVKAALCFKKKGRGYPPPMNDFRDYTNYCNDTYLAHHGIKNQQWGVRNGPPYPLDKKTSAKVKAGKGEKRSDSFIVGSQHTSSRIHSSSYTMPTATLNEIGGWDNFYKKDKEFQKQYKNSDNELKEVVKFGNSKWQNIAEFSDVRQVIESNFKEGKGEFRLRRDAVQDIRKNGFSDYRSLIENVNDDGEHNNCSKCSDLVELVSRGMNPGMFSAGRSKFGMLNSATSYHWDGATVYKEKSYSSIENRIKKFGNHGSGTIGIRRADGSGHSMHFSAISGGRIEVQDGQNGRIYSSLSAALTAEGHDPTQFCNITRLDNATPNIDHMVEDSVIRPSNTWRNGTVGIQDMRRTRKGADWDVKVGNQFEFNRRTFGG